MWVQRAPIPLILMFSDQFDTSVMAIFGQLEFDISDDMEIAVAGRFDREERDVQKSGTK